MNSLHCHSTWSDGTNSIRDMALAARAAGLDAFGISDHLVLPPKGMDPGEAWWIAPRRLGEYFAAAQAVKRELSDEKFKVYIGLEADYFPETVDCLREMTALYDFDYVIGAAHYAGNFPIDHSAALWENLTPEQCFEVWNLYLDKLLGLCASGCFDWVAHPDLPKKFGFRLPEALRPKMGAVVRAVADADMAIELNLAGLDKECREAYPAEWILEMAVEKAIPVAMVADAHSVKDVARHFRAGRMLLSHCGVEPAPVSHLLGHRR